MNVAREVILDLLPLYLDGEASAASRHLVEEHLSRDPELAERVRALGASELVGKDPGGPRPEVELESLRRTRRLLTTLRWLFGLGIACTSLGMALQIHIENGRLTGVRMVILDLPQVLGPLLGAGLGCLAAYFVLRRKLRVSPG